MTILPIHDFAPRQNGLFPLVRRSLQCERSLRGLRKYCCLGFLVDVLVALIVIAWVRKCHIEVLDDGKGNENQKDCMVVVKGDEGTEHHPLQKYEQRHHPPS